MSTDKNMVLRLDAVAVIHPLIRQFTWVATEGRLPAWSPGAHVQFQVKLPDGSADWRHYSLIDGCGQPCDLEAPDRYIIAVRLEEGGRGGSRFMHESLQVGDLIEARPPRNDFPVHEGLPCAVLLAGGIGVTPLLSMATNRLAKGEPVRMVYAGRSRDQMAYLGMLSACLGDKLTVHVDEEGGAPLDVKAVLADCAPDDELYVCGPQPMIDAVLAAAQAQGMSRERIHVELFSAPSAESEDGAFEVVLAQSGESYTVRADQSILDCLVEHGHDLIYDCQRGECGVCAVPVLEGEIDHRDYVLSPMEREAGNVIQICVSRAKGGRLVLDI